MVELDHVVHRDLPATRMWGYGGSFPGPTIEARRDVPVSVRWINNLPLEHLLPVDTSVHGAGDPFPEVRAVVHLHGGHALPQFDGYPEDWFTPDGVNVVDYEYANDQPPTTLFYHDHALGITRLNVYAGLAGFYLIRDDDEDSLGLPSGDHEIPLAIMDRSFNEDGSLFYPTTPDPRTTSHGFPDPPDPSVVSMFFGDTIVVNGKAWPYVEVEPHKYRLRVLNACNSRTLVLRLGGAPFQQIGSDGGLLPAPVTLTDLTLAPAERADIVVDFAQFGAGADVVMANLGPDGPFTGASDPPADSATTGAVMQFRVVAEAEPETGQVPDTLTTIVSLSTNLPERDMELKQERDQYGRVLLTTGRAQVGRSGDRGSTDGHDRDLEHLQPDGRDAPDASASGPIPGSESRGPE